jgi:Phage tail tube protein, GTA-gp10
MTHNKYRGEISARLDGRDYRLCLSLGALAELEAAFEEDDMVGLACRFENGRLKSSDAIRVIGAGLRGAGHEISNEAVALMRSDDGAGGYVSIVVQLLEATFGIGERAPASGRASDTGASADEGTVDALGEEGRPDPFHGTT